MCDIIEIVYYMSKHVPAFNKFLLEQGAVQQFICDSQILPESVLYIYNNIVSTYAAALPRMLVGKDDVLFIYKYSVSALINCGNNTSIMVASLTLIVEIVKTAQFEL